MRRSRPSAGCRWRRRSARADGSCRPAPRPGPDQGRASIPFAPCPAPMPPDGSAWRRVARRTAGRILSDAPRSMPAGRAPAPYAAADARKDGGERGHARHRLPTPAPDAQAPPAAAGARVAARSPAPARTARAARRRKADSDGTPRPPRAAAVRAHATRRLPCARRSSGTGSAASGLGGTASSAL